MSNAGLRSSARVVTVVAAVLYAVLAVLSRRPKAAEREVRAPARRPDQARRRGHDDGDGARSGPAVRAHPVPAAWLDAVARAGRPVAMSELRCDPELCERCETFVREQNARHARWMRPVDRAASAALIVTWLLGLFYAGLLRFSGGHRPPGGIAGGVGLVLLLGVLFAVVPSWFVSRVFPDPPELFREHCAGLSPHPATGLLDLEWRALLRVSSAFAMRTTTIVAAFDRIHVAVWLDLAGGLTIGTGPSAPTSGSRFSGPGQRLPFQRRRSPGSSPSVLWPI